MSLDYNRVAMLLHVFDKVKEHPNLDHIRQSVLKELQEINDEGKAESKAQFRSELKPTRPVQPDGQPDTTNDPSVKIESIERNPNGTVRAKTDPLDAPVERRV